MSAGGAVLQVGSGAGGEEAGEVGVGCPMSRAFCETWVMTHETTGQNSPGCPRFARLYRANLGGRGRLAQQQMHVLRHYHVSIYAHVKTSAHVFQGLNKLIAQVRARQVGPALIATKGDKVGLRGLLKTSQTTWHRKKPTPVPLRISVMPNPG